MTSPYIPIVGPAISTSSSFPLKPPNSRTRYSVVITSSIQWKAPANVFYVEISMVGGGGGGGAGVDGSTYGSGGGGGAAIAPGIIQVIPGGLYVITIGAGGNGATNGNSNSTDGGITSFVGEGISLYCEGGKRGNTQTSLSVPGGAGGVSGGKSSFGLLGVSGGTGGAVDVGSYKKGGNVENSEGGAASTGSGGGASLFAPGGSGAAGTFGSGGGGGNNGSNGGTGFVKLTWEQ